MAKTNTPLLESQSQVSPEFEIGQANQRLLYIIMLFTGGSQNAVLFVISQTDLTKEKSGCNGG